MTLESASRHHFIGLQTLSMSCRCQSTEVFAVDCKLDLVNPWASNDTVPWTSFSEMTHVEQSILSKPELLYSSASMQHSPKLSGPLLCDLHIMYAFYASTNRNESVHLCPTLEQQQLEHYEM